MKTKDPKQAEQIRLIRFKSQDKTKTKNHTLSNAKLLWIFTSWISSWLVCEFIFWKHENDAKILKNLILIIENYEFLCQKEKGQGNNRQAHKLVCVVKNTN